MSIADEVLRRALPAACLGDLPGDPFGGRVRSDTEPQDAPSTVSQDEHPYSSRNEIVGTTKRSIEAIPSTWFRRNVLQPCDGGRRCRAMYVATEVWPTSMPSLRSSPWMRGAPQRGFARVISRISCRTSRGTLGLPGRR